MKYAKRFFTDLFPASLLVSGMGCVRKFPVILYVACMLAVSSNASELNKQGLAYWSELISAHEFADVLSMFKAGPKEQWPPVHSVDYAGYDKEHLRDMGIEFRKLGELLVHGLEDHERALRQLSTEQFCENAESLLAMRRHIARSPSYFNFIIIDSINRVLYVNLAERCASEDNLSPRLLTLVELLGSFRPDLEQLRLMANSELNKAVVDEALYSSASPAEQLKMLWSALEPKSLMFAPDNALNLLTYQLVSVQDIQVLLVRLIQTDLCIHTLLPAFLQYRQECTSYSPAATYQDIKAVIGRYTKAPESLGNDLFGVTRAAPAASYLLEDVQYDKIRGKLLFPKLNDQE